jgi:2-keto-4-pentenoate hydratase
MTPQQTSQAAEILWTHWQAGRQLDSLPSGLRPATRLEGYAIQDAIQVLAGQKRFGWKIAATSVAGQKHIGVDGPLAGRLLGKRVLPEGTPVPLSGNIMRVIEAEFAFRMGSDLPGKDRPYAKSEVMAATAALHLAIEIPDSRYSDFPKAGAAQLIADNACASWFVLGSEVHQDWRHTDLPSFVVTAERNGSLAREGKGANVLGDPCEALTWIANELNEHGMQLRAGEVVTTGTCIVPLEVAPEDQVVAHFGTFGSVTVRLSA